MVEALRTTRHPAFGLDGSWSGPRRVGDVPMIGEVIESLGLVHGGTHDPVRLEVHATRVASQDMDPMLAQRCGLIPPTDPAGPPHRTFLPLDDGILVDGQRLPTEALVADQGWLLRAGPAPGINVYVHGHGIDPGAFAVAHGLVHLEDLGPYLTAVEAGGPGHGQRGAT